MRQLLHATRALSWPSLRHTRGRLLGLPFVLVACAPGLLFHWQRLHRRPDACERGKFFWSTFR